MSLTKEPVVISSGFMGSKIQLYFFVVDDVVFLFRDPSAADPSGFIVDLSEDKLQVEPESRRLSNVFSKTHIKKLRQASPQSRFCGSNGFNVNFFNGQQVHLRKDKTHQGEWYFCKKPEKGVMSSITARSINLTPDYFESLGTIKPIQNSKTPQYAKYDVMVMHKHRVSIIYHNDCILLHSLNEGISETSPGYLIKNACSQKRTVKSVTKVPATFKKQINSSVQHYYHGSALSTCSTLLHHTCEDCHFGIGRYYDNSNLTPHGTYIFKLIARKALFDMAKNNYAFKLRRGEDKAFDKVLLQFYVPKDNSRIVVI